jgi:succinate-acetate transporter protein
LKIYRPCSGLFAFASTTLVLSLYNVQARHVTVPNVVVGMALFYGGLAQLLAGMWEFATGNTFGATGKYLGKFSYHPFFGIQVGGIMVHLTFKSIITLFAPPLSRQSLANIHFFFV